MTKKKIGIIIYSNPDYYPPTVNAIHLLADHFDVILIGRNHEPPHWQYPPNVTVYRLGKYTSVREREQASAISKLWEYIAFVKQSRFLLKNVSLIYAYDAFAYTAACFCQLLLLHKVYLIYQNHEISKNLPSLYSLSGWIQRAEQICMHRAASVIFPDKDRADFFQKFVNLKNTPLIIPNFPLKSVFTLEKNWESLIQKRWQSVTLFYRGSISHASAMEEMITAASLLNKNISINFVGFLTKDNAASLEKIVNYTDMAAKFSYLGTLPYKELQVPTLQATLGFALYKNVSFDRVACVTACNKIYEYAACGLPVIVSDFPNYRDFLGNETWVRFANPDSPRSIASAVEDIMSDLENYKQMCLAARSAFENKFNYEKVFSPLLTQIKDLIGASY